MIKCPNCGSTAQVKQVGKIEVSDNGLYFVETYECGCSTRFQNLYERKIAECFIEE